jgi:PAS domain S-box-containing protein
MPATRPRPGAEAAGAKRAARSPRVSAGGWLALLVGAQLLLLAGLLAAFPELQAGYAPLFVLAAALVCLLGWAVAAALSRNARDRATAEAARQEMQVVLEAAPDGVFAVDAGWRVTFANSQAVALFGRGSALAGMTLWQAVPGPMPPLFEATYRRAMAGRTPASADGFCPLLGRRCRIDIQPRDDGGLVVFLRDVTVAEEATRRIADSEARLRRVLDKLFTFVAVLAPDGTLMEVNRAPLDAAGLTLEEVRGLPLWEGPWLRDDPATQALLREACALAATGEVLRHDITLRLPGGRRLTLDFQIAPLRDAEGRITHLIPSAVDVTARIEVEEALADSATRLHLAQEAAGFGLFERRVQAKGGLWSASMFRLYGLDPGGHGPWFASAEHLMLIHPADSEGFLARRRAWKDDPATTRYGDEFRIRRADTGEMRWIAARGEIVRDAAGNALLLRGVNYDVTERRHAEERQMLLAREVDHRAKNVLAVVQSIISLTRDADPAKFRAAVTGRIAALARAHTLLARDGWNSAGLRELVEEEIAPYRVGAEALDRVTLLGPDVALAPGAAQPLAMALHELATNAAKHGALSAPGGRVAIRWQAMENGGLSLRWSETRAEPLSGPPARRGFGYSVIRNTVERQLAGLCAFEWREEGLECRIELPASQLRWPAGVSGAD